MKAHSVLVIGASGFIATYLIDELLVQGCHVTACDIDEVSREHYEARGVEFFRLDITRKVEFDVLPRRACDAVIHLAACQPANVGESEYDPRRYVEVNVIGTLNVLEYCRMAAVPRIIYASSHRNTQALWVGEQAIREEDGRGIRFGGEYAMFSISESAAQDCVEHYRAQFGLRGIILRLPPVYGYGPHTEIFRDGRATKTGFQVFVEKALAGQPLEIWGNGSVGRDIVYVKDVVAAIGKAIEAETASGLFNIASGRRLSLREQAETIADVFIGQGGRVPLVERPELSNGMDSFLYDISKARRELGWVPKFSFRDMLVDYRMELESRRFEYLVAKRKRMLEGK